MLHRPTIYLDANATTPVLPAVAAAVEQALLQQFGNPSSSHSTGLQARHLMDTVRAKAARYLGSGDGQLLFTSGATEGIQTAVLAALCAIRARREQDGHQAGTDAPATTLLVGATEHKAVPQSLAHWNRVLGLNLPIIEIPVDRNGRHDLAFVRAHLPQAGLLCTMAANNETGVVSDLAGIQQALEQSGSPALWLVDCVQALGKLPLALAASRIDYAPFSGHKLYAPKGCGLLYVRAGSPFTPLMVGGGQEEGQRAGTENMGGIAALGAVFDALQDGTTFRDAGTLHAFRNRLRQALETTFPGVEFHAPFDGALPTTLNFSVPGMASKQLIDLFDAAGIRVSGGSACSSAKASTQTAAPSFVLAAMGLPAWQAENAIRLSFGPASSADWIEAACDRIAGCGNAWHSAPAPTTASTTTAPSAASSTPAGADACPEANLDTAAVRALLDAHPEALLVDVREPGEHLAGPQTLWLQRVAINAPLSQLEAHLPHLLQDPSRTVVFFCRSGKRSQAAVQRLRHLGHTQAWHLDGGLALAGLAS